MKPWILLILILGISTPTAGHTAMQDVLQYTDHLLTANGLEGNVPETVVNITSPHNHNVTSRESILIISILYTVEETIGTNNAEYEVTWNGTVLPNCDWEISTTGGIEDPGIGGYVGAGVLCAIEPSVGPGDHTIKIESSETGVVFNATTSILLQQRETILQVDNVNELTQTLEQFAPLILFGIIALWSEWKQEVWLYLLVVISGVTAVISVWDEIASLRLILVAALLLLLAKGMVTEMEARRDSK